MTNRECASTSAILPNSSKWLSRIGQSNYILHEIYHAMEWFDFADDMIIGSF